MFHKLFDPFKWAVVVISLIQRLGIGLLGMGRFQQFQQKQFQRVFHDLQIAQCRVFAHLLANQKLSVRYVNKRFVSNGEDSGK